MPTHPIKSLRATNFGAFSDISLDFADQLNIVVGDNGAGKSHLLKLLYACTSVLAAEPSVATSSKTALSREIAEKLVGTFRPESLGRLINRRKGRARADVRLKYAEIGNHLSFSFATNSRTDVVVSEAPDRRLKDTPVFLPTRELMSIYPGFVSLFNERVLEFDDTWRDTADLLGRSPVRGPRSEAARELLEPIESVLGGRITEDRGRFYLNQAGLGTLEMSLVAEGLRKLAMLVRLVQSGTLLQRGYLFWDEPEANLNPATLSAVAKVINHLASSGVQVFIGTHSLFLLRELELRKSDVAGSAPREEVSTRITGLRRTEEGVVAAQSGTMNELDLAYLATMEAEFDQTDRYMRADL